MLQRLVEKKLSTNAHILNKEGCCSRLVLGVGTEKVDANREGKDGM